MKTYRLDRYGVTLYGATYYKKPLFFRSPVTAWVMKMLCGLWWETYLERVN